MMDSITDLITIETILLEASAFSLRQEVEHLAQMIYAQVYDTPDAFPDTYTLVDAYKDAFITYIKSHP